MILSTEKNLQYMVKRYTTALKRFFFGTIPAWMVDFRHGKPAFKLSKFHLLASIVFAAHGLLSLFVYYNMLDTSPESAYFDVRVTSESLTSLSDYGCSVVPRFPFAFWNSNPSAGIANYVLLAWMALHTSILAFIISGASFVLFLSYHHFQDLPLSRLTSPWFRDRLFCHLCKQVPRGLSFCVFLQALTIIITLALIFFFNICDTAVIGIDLPLTRIRNCRYWVQRCVEDRHRYGRHLLCSLRENYMGFPVEPYDPAVEKDTVINFPRTYLGPTPLIFHGDFCEGERLLDSEGGPIPWCPLCTDARRDSSTKIYSKDIGPDGRRKETSIRTVELISPPFNKPIERKRSIPSWRSSTRQDNYSLLEETELSSTTKNESLYNKQPLTLSPAHFKRLSQHIHEASQTSSQAFFKAYMQTLTYFESGSHVIRILSVWGISSLCIVACYALADDIFKRHSPPEGYFVMPTSGITTGLLKKGIITSLGSRISGVIAILTCCFRNRNKQQ